MRQEIRQSTTNGQATINRPDGTAVYFSNGGVDGEFEIIITDQETIPALFEKVGEFDGDYSIKGLKLGAATPVVKLSGKYVVYGNPADGNVMLAKQK
jgi:hypothetical protein